MTAMGVCASDEEKAKEQADKVDIHEAASDGKAAEVQLVLDIYPDRVNAKTNVRQSLARLSLLVIVCGWMDMTVWEDPSRLGHKIQASGHGETA